MSERNSTICRSNLHLKANLVHLEVADRELKRDKRADL